MMLSKERTIGCMRKFLKCDSNTCLGDCEDCENNFQEDWMCDVLPSALIWLKNGEENNV